MIELIAFPRLPDVIGERTAFRHDDAPFFITPTDGRTWVVGRDGSGETIAILEQDRSGRRYFTLTGPGIRSEGESWMLLLADL